MYPTFSMKKKSLNGSLSTNRRRAMWQTPSELRPSKLSWDASNANIALKLPRSASSPCVNWNRKQARWKLNRYPNKWKAVRDAANAAVVAAGEWKEQMNEPRFRNQETIG